MGSEELDAERINELLREFGDRLARRGLTARIYVVGGAAMALNLQRDRVTADIDSALRLHASAQAVIDEMAAERGLDRRWLNSAAAGFAPPGPPRDEATTASYGALTVTVASPRQLLAMKLVSFRPQDQPDLEALFRHLHVSTPEEAVRIAHDAYGEEYAHAVGGTNRDDLLLSAREVLARIDRAKQ
jgi:hypothetical protein